MLIGKLKEVIKGLPDDADVIIQGKLKGKRVYVAGVLNHRVITVDGRLRLILENMEEAANAE